MQVNTAIPLSVFTTIRLVCLLAILVFLLVMAWQWYATRDYLSARGSIRQVSSQVSPGSGGSARGSVVHYVHCVYPVDGQEVTSRFRTFFPFLWKEGAQVTVHYDGVDPTRIRDRFVFESGIVLVVLLGVFTLFLNRAIHIRRQF